MQFFRLFPFFCLLFFAGCSGDGKLLAPVKLDGKYGYINENGKMVIGAKFQDAWSFIRGSAVVKENNKFGLIDKKGDYILQPEFDSVVPFSASVLIVQKNGKFGFIENGTGKTIIAPAYEAVFYYSDQLCVVQQGKALGLVNDKGKIVCPVEMQDFKEMMGPAAKCVKHDTTDEVAMLLALMQGGAGAKYGLINRKGEVIAQPEYDEIFDDLPSGFYYPYKHLPDYKPDTSIHLDDGTTPLPPGTYGILDTTGKKISDAIWEDIPSYGDGLFRVKKNDHYGFIGMDGKTVIEPKFDFAIAFSEGKAIVLNGSTASIIDKKGNYIVKDLGQGAGLYKFSDGRARCRNSSDGNYGYIDGMGRKVIVPMFDVADDFENGRAIVSVSNKYGLIDTTGKFIVQPQYDFFYDLGDGYYQTKSTEGKVGVIDKNGKILLAPLFEEVFHFQKNFFSVDSAGMSGSYTISGKNIFPCVSTKPVYFFSGRCIVNRNGKTGMIDSTGRILLPTEYDSIGMFFKGYATVMKNGKYGAIDSTGRIIIPTAYDEVRPVVNGFAVYRANGKFGYLTSTGSVAIEAKYEEASVLVDPDRKEFE